MPVLAKMSLNERMKRSHCLRGRGCLRQRQNCDAIFVRPKRSSCEESLLYGAVLLYSGRRHLPQATAAICASITTFKAVNQGQTAGTGDHASRTAIAIIIRPWAVAADGRYRTASEDGMVRTFMQADMQSPRSQQHGNQRCAAPAFLKPPRRPVWRAAGHRQTRSSWKRGRR